MDLNLSRVRRPSRRFGWVDRRVLTDKRFAVLGPIPVALYLFLCVVADRHGVSWYSPESLVRWVKCPPDRICSALQSLVDSGLLARAGRYIQVLDLDLVASSPAPSESSAAALRADLGSDRAPVMTARQQLEQLPPDVREKLLIQARARLVRFTGRREPSRSVLEALAASLMNSGAA